ncbi:MAG: phenylalanine--tRNA ligase subunit beta [Caldiserica bacterium]|nr:phenylalanine--tRNA ligase subunit beta [Caldisericota bacterium]
MRVSLRWLAEYVDLPDLGTEELVERLTLAGLEVEEVRELGPAEGVVLGRILSVSPHPNADRLRVCEVEAGGRTYTLVSGAPNLAEGSWVPLALPGACLPSGAEVRAVTLRGVESQGMILSAQDLSLEDKSGGVWVLPGPEGDEDIGELLELPDTLLSLKITSNRPDLLGVYGIARELAALFRTELRGLDLSFPEGGDAIDFRVTLEDPADCPRYIARAISVGQGRTPLKFAARLYKAGMRPLHPIVDVTNYVMLELGQPLHAFDLTRIPSRWIHVRRAKPGERMRTLDGVERALSPEVLLITDGERPIALAGIMGGEETEVSEGTREVLLEAANFSPARIRRGSRALGLRTEASLRFERNLSPELAELGSRRTCHFYGKYLGATVARGVAEAYPHPPARRVIALRKGRVAEILGVEVAEGEMRGILERLGIEVRDEGESFVATVPHHRTDLEREIIEEIARIYGYERIPAAPPVVPLRRGAKDPREAFVDEVRRICAALGLLEALTPGLVAAETAEVALKNPMAAGQEGLRSSLRQGLIEVVRENFAAGADGVALFEVGRVFLRREGAIVEEDRLGVALAGRTRTPLMGKEHYSPAHLKGVLDAVLAALRVADVRLGEVDAPWLHPYRRAGVYLGTRDAPRGPIGWLGELTPEAAGDIPGGPRVLMLELALPPLREARGEPRFKPLPRYPASKRDLSLLVPEGVPEASIREGILAEELVESAFLYDLYRGEGVPEGHRSLTYEIVFRHPDRTLSSEEVEGAVERILARLAPLGVRLRT